MKKLILISGVLFALTLSTVSAQTAGNTTNANTNKNKSVSNDPGKASATAKPAPQVKPRRSVHISSKTPSVKSSTQLAVKK